MTANFSEAHISRIRAGCRAAIGKRSCHQFYTVRRVAVTVLRKPSPSISTQSPAKDAAVETGDRDNQETDANLSQHPP
jgi:hypothetical protein